MIENEILPYVRELNIKYKTDHNVLILSNRIALRWQMESRIKQGMRYKDSEGEIIRNYKNYDCAHVVTYQGFLNMTEQLQTAQESELSSYIFVICDEAHFFTSDSMFNYDTEKILTTIVKIFKKSAIRVYMSATPYDCFRYIKWYEGTFGVTYHFQRNYDYLNIKYYSSYKELEELIVESVDKRDENWLVFNDYIEGSKKFRSALEGYPTMIGKVLAVDANSKDDRDYQEMVYNEKFKKGTNVLISTSVLDNGVNFRNITNVVVSDISKVKVLQMVGRARVEKGDRVTLYIKRFDAQYIENRINTLREWQDNYHSYDLTDGNKIYSDKFRDKFYHGNEHDWKVASHQFGREKDIPPPFSNVPDFIYYNKIARPYVDHLVPVYESILTEMRATDIGQEVTGQKYLEFQLSWFGKEYDKANDITLTVKGKAKEGLLGLLDTHAKNGTQMFKDEQERFRNDFTKLHDEAFPRRDKNLGRAYGLNVINTALNDHNLNYRVESQEAITPEGKRQYWKVVVL